MMMPGIIMTRKKATRAIAKEETPGETLHMGRPTALRRSSQELDLNMAAKTPPLEARSGHLVASATEAKKGNGLLGAIKPPARQEVAPPIGLVAPSQNPSGGGDRDLSVLILRLGTVRPSQLLARTLDPALVPDESPTPKSKSGS